MHKTILIFLCLFLTACQTSKTIPEPEKSPHPFDLHQVSYSDLPNWNNDHLSDAWPAYIRSCQKLKYQPRWQKPCAAAFAMKNPSESAIRKYYKTWFKPYEVRSGKTKNGLFTGYYEPEIYGSLVKSARFHSPIYKRPGDLVMIEDAGIFKPNLRGVRLAGRVINGNLKPYYSHADIDNGALAGNELIWVEDPVDAFFIHVQGSATVKLDNGEVMRIGYAGTNGHTYTSIGSVLIQQYGMSSKDMSMQTIRSFLRTHPELMKSILQQNASYVFFTERTGEGPLGDQGVVLTPGRSLAVDPRYISHGTPVWLNITGIQKMVIAQDKGGAIKGPIRGDLFWGTGDVAGDNAGTMKASGNYFVLIPVA